MSDLGSVAVEAGEFDIGLERVPHARRPVSRGGHDSGMVQPRPGQGGHSFYWTGVAVKQGWFGVRS